MIAARTRIWPAHGHYMGLILGLFWQMGVFNGLDFCKGQSEGFTGVFQVSGGRSNGAAAPCRVGLAPEFRSNRY
jgi:hypothetical protein